MSWGNKSLWVHGQKDVAAAGTAVQLPSHPVPDDCQVTVIAKPGNIGTIYLGNSKANAEGSDRFDGLSPGLAHSLKITNTDLIWVDASDNGDGVSFSAEQG